jgi:polysaccharide pyruvyl transferase WcaK-like protein
MIEQTCNKDITICLVGGGFSLGNFGVSAMTRGNLLSLFKAFPNAKVLLADYGVGPEVSQLNCNIRGKQYVIEKIMFRYSQKLHLPNNIFKLLLVTWILRMVPLPLIGKSIMKSSEALRKISGADVICSIAGGDSFSDIYGFRQFLYVNVLVLLGIGMRKPIVLLPQTYGPIKGTVAKVMSKYILRKTKIIYSRDHAGLNYLKELNRGPLEQASFSYDMGFGLEALPPSKELVIQIERIKNKGGLVGINISGLLSRSEYSGKNVFGLKSSYHKLVETLIRHCIRELNMQVILIPHVIGGGGVESESDDSACERIYEKCLEEYGEKIWYISGPFDHHTVKYLIGKCDYFIGVRMHSCIAALSQSIPTVALAYSDKYIGVLDSIDVSEYVSDLRRDDEKDVICMVNRMVSSSVLLKEQLNVKMKCVLNEVMGLYSKDTFQFLQLP